MLPIAVVSSLGVSRARARLTAHLPGTRAFEQRHAAAIRTHAETRFEVFLGLASLAPERKIRIAGEVGAYFQQEAHAAVLRRATTKFERDAAVALVGVPALIWLLATRLRFGPEIAFPADVGNDAVALLAALAAAYFAVLLLTVACAFSPRASTRRGHWLPGIPLVTRSQWSLATLIAFGGPAYIGLSSKPVELSTPLLALSAGSISGFGVGLVVVTVMFLMGTLMALVDLAFVHGKYATRPDAHFVSQLVDFANTIEQYVELWANLQLKCIFFAQVEALATLIERDIPAKLVTLDAQTDQQVSAKFASIGAGFRAWKTAIATPRSDTREWLLETTSSALEHFVSGDWDALPTSDTAPPKARQSAQSVARRVFGAATGCAPFAAFVFVAQVHLLEGSSLNVIGVATFAFALASFLAALDPNFTATVRALKDLGAPELIKSLSRPKSD